MKAEHLKLNNCMKFASSEEWISMTLNLEDSSEDINLSHTNE